jgi:peptidoglycan/LPS O-acetylase OafA/YrhL
MVSPQRAVQPARRMEYFAHVEGLRGVAALYVFLYHVWQNGIYARSDVFDRTIAWSTGFLSYGHYAVPVFIVISGFCLGMPIVRRRDAGFDAVRFAKRRALRLMPAYLLALAASVPLLFATHALRGDHVPVSGLAASMAAHVMLVHNLFRGAALSINAPMWSIALECQIYVIFALVLIPVWRRFGWAAQLLVAVLLGLVPHFARHGYLDWTAPWMLGLFGMGFAAAALRTIDARRAPRWLALAVGGAALAVVVPSSAPSSVDWAKDSLVGVAVAFFLLTSTRGDGATVAGRVLALRPIVLLGTFSYSLYLVHGPLVASVCALLVRLRTGAAASVIAYAALVAGGIGIAYVLYRLAERPFMSDGLRRSNDAAVQSFAAPNAQQVEGPSPMPSAPAGADRRVAVAAAEPSH